MWIFQVIVILIDIILMIVLLNGWCQFKPSMRRILMAVIMGVSLMGFPQATFSAFNDMKDVNFCLSCHSMQEYGESLKVDDDEPLSAVHWANNYVKQEQACYACHTDYGAFGGVKAKINGMRHLWVHYFDKNENREIELYEPYNPHNCLNCHGPGKRFREVKQHKRKGILPDILNGKKSCMVSGCHDVGHLKPSDMDDDDEDEDYDEEESDEVKKPEGSNGDGSESGGEASGDDSGDDDEDADDEEEE